MKYGTLVDGRVVVAPNPLHMDGYFVYNPMDEQYAAAGYLPIIETPYPQDEDKYYTAHWEELEGQIVRVWIESEPPEIEPEQPTLEQRVCTVENVTAALEADLELLLSGETEEVGADGA